MATFDKTLLKYLSPEEIAEMDALLDDGELWRPMSEPQIAACSSKADITGFGGAGGGGKTDFICGLALTKHTRTIIFRETGTELVGINTRLRDLLTPHGGTSNGRDNTWSFVRPRDQRPCSIELGSFPDIGDEQKYRGRDHDLLAFDEATNMRQSQVRFLFAWARTTDPEQPVRIVLTFNPPNTVEGRWIIDFFAPWLDDKHPNPALPGELRWFATIGGVDIEVPDNRRFVLGDKNERIYEFKEADYKLEDIISPQSRTFIPSRVVDNPFLVGTGYMRTLQALPEPLRSQMLLGDFRAGQKDDAYQVIPTSWVDAAMARWTKPAKLEPMDSLGADIAMGGDDLHVHIARHKNWYSEPVEHPGKAVLDGAVSGSLILASWRDNAVIHLDLFGVGAMTYGYLMSLNLQVVGVNFGDLVPELRDRTGRLSFVNLRSYLWWRMRDLLDPQANTGIALPPNKMLRADLCAPKWKPVSQRIKVQSRDEIIASIGRSPDHGTAAILASIDTPKAGLLRAAMSRGNAQRTSSYDPYSGL